MKTIATRVITALAAPAIAAGILTGGLALGIAAPATAAQSCTTAGSLGVTPNAVNPLTRPAQVNAIQPPTHVFAPPSSCLGS